MGAIDGQEASPSNLLQSCAIHPSDSIRPASYVPMLIWFCSSRNPQPPPSPRSNFQQQVEELEAFETKPRIARTPAPGL